MLYRITTEDKFRDAVIAELAKKSRAFTVIEAIGYWRAEREKSIIIEIDIPSADDADTLEIETLAGRLRDIAEQECVMVQRVDAETKLI